MSNFPDDIDAHVESYGGWLDLGESDSQASLLTPSKVTIADANLKGKSVKVKYTESGERFWVEVIHHDVEPGGLYGLVANDLVQTPLDAWHPIFFHVFHVREVQLFEEADLAVPGDKGQARDQIEGSLGEGSQFAIQYSYYAEGVTGICPYPTDLCAAKALAGREKDWEFIIALWKCSNLDLEDVLRSIHSIDNQLVSGTQKEKAISLLRAKLAHLK